MWDEVISIRLILQGACENAGDWQREVEHCWECRHAKEEAEKKEREERQKRQEELRQKRKVDDKSHKPASSN